MTRTAVYRHFNAGGRLLYVGCSHDPLGRFVGHKCKSSWAYDVVRIDVEWHATKEGALAAEAAAIKRERPPFNDTWRVKSKSFWPANQGHVFICRWMKMSGFGVSYLARRLGVTQRESRKLRDGVVQIQTRKAMLICLATDGYVPLRAWDRYRFGELPILYFPSEEEAHSNFEYAKRLMVAHGAPLPLYLNGDAA